MIWNLTTIADDKLLEFDYVSITCNIRRVLPYGWSDRWDH